MKIHSFRLAGIRCFDDTGDLQFSPRINLFVGENNAGKSTLLKGLWSFQGAQFDRGADMRMSSSSSFHSIYASGLAPTDYNSSLSTIERPPEAFLTRLYRGAGPGVPGTARTVNVPLDSYPLFAPTRPNHQFVPFLARRKAPGFNQNVTKSFQAQVTGDFTNLYSRVDLVVTAGHPKHHLFVDAVNEIVGLPITTTAADGGKEAGFYLNDNEFINFERMGDGVTELIAQIVELCLERNKVFILEEPETNLHPYGLKALLKLIRKVSENNQFVIATHSNIVVRELAADDDTKVFRVFRTDSNPGSASRVEELERTPRAHAQLLRELGYEFTDIGLYEGWLFLEESSAEEIIREYLIPTFVPSLRGRLRTFSAGGASKVEPTVSEFQRLVTFVHLQPAYEGRLWIRADGDMDGTEAVAALRKKFSYLTEEACMTFSQPHFEHYYPSRFDERVREVLSIAKKAERREQKAALLRDVIQWTRDNAIDARSAWGASAVEIVSCLHSISDSLERR